MICKSENIGTYPGDLKRIDLLHSPALGARSVLIARYDRPLREVHTLAREQHGRHLQWRCGRGTATVSADASPDDERGTA